MLNDFIEKKSAATEIYEILTGSKVTLNSAQDHFNFHFIQIGPNLASNLPTSYISAEDYCKKTSLLLLNVLKLNLHKS